MANDQTVIPANQLRVTAAMYGRVFEGHREGKAILEDLIKRFGGNLFVKGGEEGRRQTDYNLGQRAVLDFILLMINQANGIDPNSEGNES